MSQAPSPLAKFQTKCKQCGKIFRSAGVPIIGEAPDKAAETFLASLVDHLMKHHKEVLQQCYFRQAQYGGVLFIEQFETDDPQLREQRELSRHQIHKYTQRVHISDATIEKRLKELESRHTHDAPLDAIDGGPEIWWIRVNDVLTLMKEFRDVLEEFNLHPPRPAPESATETRTAPENASEPVIN